MFSLVFQGGEYPSFWSQVPSAGYPGLWSHVPSGGGGTPVSGPMSLLGGWGTPRQDSSTPHRQDRGTPPPTGNRQYAPCSYAGGLSC